MAVSNLLAQRETAAAGRRIGRASVIEAHKLRAIETMPATVGRFLTVGAGFARIPGLAAEDASFVVAIGCREITSRRLAYFGGK